jgi:hypothetical protein
MLAKFFARFKKKPKQLVNVTVTRTKMVLTIHMNRATFQRTFHDEELENRVRSASENAERWMTTAASRGHMWDGNKFYYPWSSMTKIEAIMTEWKEEVEKEK